MKPITARRIASRKLGAGVSRIWIDSKSMDDVSDAATASDLDVLIRRHVIQVRPKKGNSSYRLKKRIRQKSKERRRGPGSIKGSKYARFPRKRRWVKTIRPLRDELRGILKQGSIDRKTYRKYYRIIKSGTVKSRAQLRSNIAPEMKGGEN